MVTRRVATLSCAVTLVVALAACSHKTVQGAGGLSTVGSATPSPPASEPATPATTPSPSPSLTLTPHAGHTTAKGSPPTTHPKTTQPSAPKTSSSPPEEIDYGFSWSNADCHWIVYADGKANVGMDGWITVSGASKTGNVTVRVTDDGGTLQTAEIYRVSLLPADTRLGYGADFFSTGAALAGKTITYTGTLVFDDVADTLSADDTASLKVTFPPTFVAGNDGEENLGCSHV